MEPHKTQKTNLTGLLQTHLWKNRGFYRWNNHNFDNMISLNLHLKQLGRNYELKDFQQRYITIFFPQFKSHPETQI
jgi:hypothetical protein